MIDSFVTIKLEGKDDTCVQLFPDTGFFRVVEQKMDLLFFSNGSAQMTEVDGQDELIALYAYNNQLRLFFKHQSYVLNPYHSSASIHSRLFRKSIFTLKASDQEVLRIVFKRPFVELDVLESITNLLSPKDKESVANKMQWKVNRFAETDLVKRTTLDLQFSEIERKNESLIWKGILPIWPDIVWLSKFMPVLIACGLWIVFWLIFTGIITGLSFDLIDDIFGF